MPWVPVPHAVSSQNLQTKLSTEADGDGEGRPVCEGSGEDTAGDADHEPSSAPALTSPCAVVVLVHASAAHARPGHDQKEVQSRHWLWLPGSSKRFLRLPWAFSQDRLQDHIARR